VARLAGPTGGYLLAFPAAAWLVGLSAERLPRRWWTWLAAALAAEALVLAAGTAWLALVMQTSLTEAARLGAWPFLPGSFAKAALVALCLPASWWAVEKTKNSRA
jgi:biotin transport system substrate-specific component